MLLKFAYKETVFFLYLHTLASFAVYNSKLYLLLNFNVFFLNFHQNR